MFANSLFYMHVILTLSMMVSSFTMNKLNKSLMSNSYLKAKKIDFEFMDEVEPPEGYNYWNDPRIHTLGNEGFGGYIHSLVAPGITKLIDEYAYNGVNIRKEVLNKWNDKNLKILDLCCGTGLSTPDGATGVDTSKHMIRRARKINSINKGNKHFEIGNAETWVNLINMIW